MPAPIRVSPTAGPIDGRVRANLDVVFDNHVGVLRDLQVRAVRLLGEAEAVAADDRAVVQDHAVADLAPLADRDVRVDHAVVAEPGTADQSPPSGR